MKIGFIGLGNVGAKLAASFLRNGFDLMVRDGLARFGPRVWSSMVVKRLEDACGEDLRAPGFPACLTDDEPEAAGAEVKPRQACQEIWK